MYCLICRGAKWPTVEEEQDYTELKYSNFHDSNSLAIVNFLPSNLTTGGSPLLNDILNCLTLVQKKAKHNMNPLHGVQPQALPTNKAELRKIYLRRNLR